MRVTRLQIQHLAAALQEGNFEDPRWPLTFDGDINAGFRAAARMLDQAASDDAGVDGNNDIAFIARRVFEIFPDLSGFGLTDSIHQVLIAEQPGDPPPAARCAVPNCDLPVVAPTVTCPKCGGPAQMLGVWLQCPKCGGSIRPGYHIDPAAREPTTTMAPRGGTSLPQGACCG